MDCENRRISSYQEAHSWWAVFDDNGIPTFDPVAFWATFTEANLVEIDGMSFCGCPYPSWCQEAENFLGYHHGNIEPETDSDSWNYWRRQCVTPKTK